MYELSSVRYQGEPAGFSLAPLCPVDSLVKHGWLVSRSYQRIKRWLDLCLCTLVLLMVSLIFCALAVTMMCISGWPLLFRQYRIGLGGRLFIVYKLRTMSMNADEYLRRHPALFQVWQRQGKMLHDPRITRIGRILRRYSLDELPQLVNVLRGEMSLVGPRPMQGSEISDLGAFSALRHSVRPGLTGLWQIHGRARLSYEQRCILDCLYIMKCSLREDLYIIFKTVPAIFTGKGAY